MGLTQVNTDGVKDDAVTLAKQAAGTDGQVITYDASGNPVAVGPGTDGQVLTSTGAGSPPAFEDLPAGGATINNATENEIVTVASNTAQLDAEANLTFDGTTLTASGSTTAANNTNTDANIIAGSQTLIRQKGNNAGIGGDAYPSQIISGTAGGDLELYTINSNCDVVVGTQATERFRIESDGDVKINDGNLVIGTSGHGINFSATSDAGGMTSELFDDYEEGTWNVTFKGTDGGSSSFSSTGHYIKVGRVVHCTVTLVNITNNGVGGTLEISAPFAAGSDIAGQSWRGGDIYFYPQSTWDTYTDHTGFSPQINAGESQFLLSIKTKDGDRQSVVSAGNNSNISTASGVYCKFSITYWVAA